MNKELISTGIYIITFLLGIFMLVCGMTAPKKMIFGKLNENDIIDNEKFILCNRVLYIFGGSTVVLISVVTMFNIIDRRYTGILYSATGLLSIISSSISKRYLVKNHRRIW